MRRLPLLALVCLLALGPPAFARSPNVVLVYADDLGYADIGPFGGKIDTPNLDRLAKEGRTFKSFYVAQAVCSASRAALMTGCYPNRIGIAGALNPGSRNGIHDRETTLGELFKSKGYATAIFGKWHLGHHPQFLPTRHGFDEYFGLPYSNDMWPKHPTAGLMFPPLPLVEGEKTVETNPDQTKLTTWYAERAVGFIERNKDKPFFLYVPHAMPHVPLFVSDKFKGKSKQGLFGDVVMELDWSVGEILKALDKHKLAEDTLVVFTSDNGPWLSYGNHAGSAGPLREGKGTAWEGGVRVPCVTRWPGKIPAGTACDEPAMTIDLLPTFARIVGAELPEHPIDGKDIGDLLAGKPGAKSPQEAYYFYWNQELRAVRSGDWKLVFPHEHWAMEGTTPGADGKPGGGFATKTPLALYHLAADVGEKTNLVGKEPDVVKRLQALADKMRDDLGDTATKKPAKNVRPSGKVE